MFWVSATPEFNVKDVVRKIVASASDEAPLNYEMDQLHQCLFRAIAGKRFLLVLDSVWDQDSLRSEWLKLRSLFLVGVLGSKVVITTRSDTVARMMGTEDPHIVGDFDDDTSWLLFKHVAFTRWHEPGMEDIGKEIAKMCPKVPLIIRAIGSLLAGKHTAHEWRTFRDDQLSNFASYGRDVMGTLKLSYDHLDERLKLCVLYCSLLPKGFEFNKNEMIRLWIAMGYVAREFTNQSLEYVAEAYILCLLKQVFFYCDKKNIYECPSDFWTHNLMHDLVVSIAGHKYKLADSSTDEFDERLCHVSFASAPESSWAAPSSLLKIKHLKSFLVPIELDVCFAYFCRGIYFIGLEIFMSRVQSLRVLRLLGLGINKLPRSLGELIHLRYLDLSFNAFRKLPESVTLLVHLYLLDLSYCKSLEVLPKDINKLVMLRHLRIAGCSNLGHMPKGLVRLTGLETLNLFVVGKPSSVVTFRGSKIDFVCGLADLCHFHNINGALMISLVNRSKDIVLEAKAANLHKKENITHFHMDFKESTIKDEMVLDNLKPGANLTSLWIDGYAGKQLPCWMREGIHCWLPNLVEVKLSDCNGCIYLCSFGRLSHLKSLKLRNMDKVEYIENGNSSNDNAIVLGDEHSSTPLFPSLELLCIEKITNLKGWWGVTDFAQEPVFPKLKRVTMDMEVIVSLAGVFRQGIDSLRDFYVTGNNYVETAEQSCILFKNHLPMLHQLRFTQNDIKFLPEMFQGLSSVESVWLYDCKCLEAIPDWIDSLASLTTLIIVRCPGLKSLPSRISNFSNLKSLNIQGCSWELVERCEDPTGEDWPKIQHIPYINIVPPNDDDDDDDDDDSD